MSSLAERFADHIDFEYSLIDRMRVRGHIMNLQTVGMLGEFFRRFRGVDWIERRDLERVTEDFIHHVERLAAKNNIPLLKAHPGESHVDRAAEYLDTLADRDEGIYCILKVQETTSSFVSYVPKKGPDKARKIARGRRRINHYYFFIKDRQFGTGNWIRIASYAPFTVTVCFNGHHVVAQQLRNRGVGFQTRDNLFVAVDDHRAFQRALASLTHQAIARFCDRWVYRCIHLFPPQARRQGFRYQWFLDQVEYLPQHDLPPSAPARRFVRSPPGSRAGSGAASRDFASLPATRACPTHRRPHLSHAAGRLLLEGVAQEDLHQAIQQARRGIAYGNLHP
jgi:hypothetical protein